MMLSLINSTNSI